MDDKDIITAKEIINDLHTYCFLTSATSNKMGFEFCENDFDCLNGLIDFINRQKAVIEELTTRNDKLKNHFTIKFDHDKLKEIVKKAAEKIEIDIKQVKAEAIREFEEKLKKGFASLEHRPEIHRKTIEVEKFINIVNWVLHEVTTKEIDRVVKEMVGEDNGNL